MTSDASRDTPPPAPRPTIRDPPPAPRKPRRGVRKSRRRRPRSDERQLQPTCAVCHSRRPLRASGLCWSLACALKMAQDETEQSTVQSQQHIPHAATAAPTISSEDPQIHSSEQLPREAPLTSESASDELDVPSELQSVLHQRGDAEAEAEAEAIDVQPTERGHRASDVDEIERQDKDVYRNVDKREDDAT